MQHSAELATDRARETAEERLAGHNLRHKHLLNQVNEDIDAIKKGAVVDWKSVAMLRGTAQRVIGEIPKYDGTTVVNVHQVVEHISENETGAAILRVFTNLVGEEAALAALQEAQKLIVAPKGEIVDAEFTDGSNERQPANSDRQAESEAIARSGDADHLAKAV
jgi:alkylated DNA nucleotide flippase Atl1